MALGGKVVDFVRLRLLHQANERRAVGHIAVMKVKCGIGRMRILIDFLDPARVERRGAALEAVDFVTFVEQKLRQIGAILSGDAGDKCVRNLLAARLYGSAMIAGRP